MNGRKIQFCAFNNTGDGNLFDDMNLIDEIEILAGRKLAWAMGYVYFGQSFPMEACRKIYERNTFPHITWELWFPSMGSDAFSIKEKQTILDEVLEGKHDAYISEFCREAREYGHPVIIRLLHEFNGNWYIWSGFQNGAENGGPEKVKKVWKHVVDIARANGAYNMIWMWCPHGPSIDLPEGKWNDIENYYPGDDYVDWFAIDAYNWYPSDHFGVDRPYRDFDNCFSEVYGRLTAIADKPIAIAETGVDEFEYASPEGMKGKPQWIEDSLMKLIEGYPAIRMITWFNIKKEKDWRINSSPESLEAFRRLISDENFTSDPDIIIKK